MFSSAAAFLHCRWSRWSICHVNRHVFLTILLTFLQFLHSKIPSLSKRVKTRHIWRHDLQTESTGSRRSELIGDSCLRCERVDNSSWVELRRRRYRHFADATQLNSTLNWVELSCVAINPLKISLIPNNRLLSYDQTFFGRPPSCILKFFTFGHVTVIEFQICCCIIFIKIIWFLSRVSTLTRDIDIANLSICPSVTFRYQMKTAQHVVIVFFTIR